MQEQYRYIGRDRADVSTLASVIALAVLMSPCAANAQIIKISLGKPKVPVTIKHSGTLSVALAGKKVAFGPVAPGCSQEFAELMMQDFVKQGVTVVDRANLTTILAEHRFQLTGSVDPSTAIQLGKLLGPAIMIMVNLSRCEVRKREPLYKEQMIGPRVNISRTEAHFRGSVNTVDLATGLELGVLAVEANPAKENTAPVPTRPEYPGDFELRDEALHDISAQAHRLYFPWTETREVSFMNSKECNLKQAYDTLKTGDIAAVLKLSQENVNLCKSDPKQAHQADALYNLGVAQMLSEDYDNALATLEESQRVHADKATVETIAGCRAARTAALAKAKSDKQIEIEGKAEVDNQHERETHTAEGTLTNADVIEFATQHISDDVVIKMIASTPAKFSLLPKDILALKQAGVSDKVVGAMLDKK